MALRYGVGAFNSEIKTWLALVGAEGVWACWFEGVANNCEFSVFGIGG